MRKYGSAGGEDVGVGCCVCPFGGLVGLDVFEALRFGSGTGDAVETRGRLFVAAIVVVIP